MFLWRSCSGRWPSWCEHSFRYVKNPMHFFFPPLTLILSFYSRKRTAMFSHCYDVHNFFFFCVFLTEIRFPQDFVSCRLSTPLHCETFALHLEAVRYLNIRTVTNYQCQIPQWLVAWDHNLLCKSNISPFAVKMLIAECKDNAYLYRTETPMNKVLKFTLF